MSEIGMCNEDLIFWKDTQAQSSTFGLHTHTKVGTNHFLQPKTQFDFRDRNQLSTLKYGKENSLISSKYRLQLRCTLVCLRLNSLVRNGRVTVKIKSNYRGLKLSHTHIKKY